MIRNPGRTIIVVTRLSDTSMAVTYLNSLDSPSPYIITITRAIGEPTIGVRATDVPAVGHTHTVLSRWQLEDGEG